jgi:hypothetical protein
MITQPTLRYFADLLGMKVISAHEVFGWWLVECEDHTAFWVHARSQVVLTSARNWNRRSE